MPLSSEEDEAQFLSEEEDGLNDLSSDLSDESDDADPFSSALPSSEQYQHQQQQLSDLHAPHHSHVSPAPPPTQHTQNRMLSFGPPYYGRPPTPLPPSPSLTSLLRPSRPTTPDASDDEHGPLADHPPVPRASPKVPTYEYYGFVLYLFSSCCFLIYLLWSYLPSPFLHVLGIHYYPDRWWSLAVPSFLVILLAYIYVALALYNSEYLTLPLQALETIVDEAGKVAVVDGKGRIVVSEARRRNLEREREKRSHHQRKQSGNNASNGGGNGGPFVPVQREVDWKNVWSVGTDAVMDVPLAGVCEVLYGGVRGDDDIEAGSGEG